MTAADSLRRRLIQVLRDEVLVDAAVPAIVCWLLDEATETRGYAAHTILTSLAEDLDDVTKGST